MKNEISLNSCSKQGDLLLEPEETPQILRFCGPFVSSHYLGCQQHAPLGLLLRSIGASYQDDTFNIIGASGLTGDAMMSLIINGAIWDCIFLIPNLCWRSGRLYDFLPNVQRRDLIRWFPPSSNLFNCLRKIVLLAVLV